MKKRTNVLCALAAGGCVLLASAAVSAVVIGEPSGQPSVDVVSAAPEAELPCEDLLLQLSETVKPAEPVPGGWSEARKALLEEVVGRIGGDWCPLDRNEAYEVYGEVGDYTLCRICVGGGDEACVWETYQGYRVFSPCVGYPSSTYLYLVGDTAVYTLNAACRDGLVADMAALYAMLPADMQAGYDPDAADTMSGEKSCWGGDDWYGFSRGIYRAS